MKKFLLMAALAAGTMSANAQVKMDQTKIQKEFAKVEVSTEAQENLTRGMSVPNMYYYRPNGLFYSGWNKAFFNPGVSYGPANTDITFVAHYQNGGVPAWAYPSGEMDANGDPLEAEAEGDELVINLPAGKYFTPMVVNLEDQQNDHFTAAGYMHLGSGVIKGTAEYQGEEVCNDGFAVNYTPCANLAFIPQYLSTANPESDAAFAGIIGDNTFQCLGFGEVFQSTAEFTVFGFNGLFIAEEGFENTVTGKKVKINMFTFTDGGLEELVSSKDITVTCDIMEAPTDGQGVYHVFCTLANPIKVKAGQAILPMFKSTKAQFSPLFDGQPRCDEDGITNYGAATMFLCAGTADGEVYTQVPGLKLTSNDGTSMYLNSWMMGLDMTYGDATGIEGVEADEVAGNGATYTVAGVKVNGENLPAGIYVKNGKKFVVR